MGQQLLDNANNINLKLFGFGDKSENYINIIISVYRNLARKVSRYGIRI